MAKTKNEVIETIEVKQFSGQNLYPGNKITFSLISFWRTLLTMDIKKTISPKDKIKAFGTIREYSGVANVKAAFIFNPNGKCFVEIYE